MFRLRGRQMSVTFWGLRIEKPTIRPARAAPLNFPLAPLFYQPICYLATPLAVYARQIFNPNPNKNGTQSN